MDKYISVFEPIGDGDRDRGEKQYCLDCSDEGIRKAKGLGSRITVEEYPLSDIVRVDCFRGDELQNNMATGAMAGLILGGAMGAVVGGMLTSGSSKEWWIEIEMNDRTVHYFRCYRDRDHEAFLKWANEKGLNIKVASNTDSSSENVSGADEILKYKQLLDQGIITQEEFDAKKEQILNL